jgi:hypothetical protein
MGASSSYRELSVRYGGWGGRERSKLGALQGERDLVGGDGAFAEDHPGVPAAGEVDDGGGECACGGTAVYDERDLVAELCVDVVGKGAFREAAEVCGGGGDRQAESGDDGAGDGGSGDTECDVAGVGGDAQRKFGAGLDDDGEGAGPVFFGEAVEGGIDLAGEFVGLRYLGDEEREGLVAGAGFDVVDAIDGAEIDGVDGEAVEGVGGESDDVAAVEAVDDAADVLRFGLVGVNSENLGGQILTPMGVVGGYFPPTTYCAKSSNDGA